MPEAVRSQIGIQEFWKYVLEKCPASKSRAAFLHAEYKPVLLQLEQPIAHLDPAPDFAPLASDERLKQILIRRWRECQVCVQAGAYFAAMVMMGGLLEGLFVARQRLVTDKSRLTNATRAPKVWRDKKQVVKPLDEWTLNEFIQVGHELGWITESAKGVSEKLRDYRNLIHPSKEHKDAKEVGLTDARFFWDLTKTLTGQLLASAATL